MDVKTLKNLLAEDAPILLIDVREPGEVSDEPYFEVWPENYLPLSLTVLAVLPEAELREKITAARARLCFDDAAMRIVTLCRSGRRSEMACPYFSRLGFPAESLDGGYDAWIREAS